MLKVYKEFLPTKPPFGNFVLRIFCSSFSCVRLIFYNKHLYCSGSVNVSSGYLAAERLEGAIYFVLVVCALSAVPPPAARPPLPAGGILVVLTY